MDRICSVLLTVSQRGGGFVKETEAQLRIEKTDAIKIIAVVEEGVFRCRVDVAASKTKEDLGISEWTQIVDALLNGENALHGGAELELAAEMHSLETYDSLGRLGDTLSEFAPDFSLIVKSKGVLGLVYGRFAFELAGDEDKENADLLQWLLKQSKQVSRFQNESRVLKKEVAELTALLEIKEEEIATMQGDYDAIIADMESRFLQVLNAKKARIFELTQRDPHELDRLNECYKTTTEETARLAAARQRVAKAKPRVVVKRETVPDDLRELLEGGEAATHAQDDSVQLLETQLLLEGGKRSRLDTDADVSVGGTVADESDTDYSE